MSSASFFAWESGAERRRPASPAEPVHTWPGDLPSAQSPTASRTLFKVEPHQSVMTTSELASRLGLGGEDHGDRRRAECRRAYGHNRVLAMDRAGARREGPPETLSACSSAYSNPKSMSHTQSRMASSARNKTALTSTAGYGRPTRLSAHSCQEVGVPMSHCSQSA